MRAFALAVLYTKTGVNLLQATFYDHSAIDFVLINISYDCNQINLLYTKAIGACIVG